jgi:hypothetical protein
VLDLHGDITRHEIGIPQLGDRDALPVGILGHEQRTELVSHVILPHGLNQCNPRAIFSELTAQL